MIIQKNNILKIFSLLIIILPIFSISSTTHALSNKDKVIISKVIKSVSKKSDHYQKRLLSQLESLVQNKKLPEDKKELVAQLILELQKNLTNNQEEIYITPINKMSGDDIVTKFQLDIPAIKQEWIAYLNTARKNYKLSLFNYNSQLDQTSQTWSNQAYQKGYIDHKVSPHDSYYDYWKKADWMKDQWIVCQNINKITFSESIAWWDIYCDGTNDCQKQLSDSIKTVYDMFMAEKWLPYPQDAHYRAIVMPEYKEIWFALSLKHKKNNWYTYYLTNHYCTKIIE